MSPHDLDDISHKDAMNMWHLYQRGMAGPSVDYITNYYTMGAIHKLTELTTSINSKNYKAKDMDKFEKLFPDPFHIMSLKEIKSTKGLSLGTQAAMALMGPGMPQHIAERLQGELDGNT